MYVGGQRNRSRHYFTSTIVCVSIDKTSKWDSQYVLILYQVSNHQPHNCLLNCLFRRKSKKTSKLSVTSLCVWHSPVTGDFPAKRVINGKNVSIWWRHHAMVMIALISKYNRDGIILVYFHVSTNIFSDQLILVLCTSMSHKSGPFTFYWCYAILSTGRN